MDVVLLFTWSIEVLPHSFSLSPLNPPFFFFSDSYFSVIAKRRKRERERAGYGRSRIYPRCVRFLTCRVLSDYYYFVASWSGCSAVELETGKRWHRTQPVSASVYIQALRTNNSCFDQLMTNMNMEAKKKVLTKIRPMGTRNIPPSTFIFCFRSPCIRPKCLLVHETEL